MIYEQFPTQINYNTFSNLRAQLKLQNIIDYTNFITKTQNSVASNPDLFWKFIKNNQSLPSSMLYNNNIISGGEDLKNCLAKLFPVILIVHQTYIIY